LMGDPRGLGDVPEVVDGHFDGAIFAGAPSRELAVIHLAKEMGESRVVWCGRDRGAGAASSVGRETRDGAWRIRVTRAGGVSGSLARGE
jgi:hypothetical protein